MSTEGLAKRARDPKDKVDESSHGTEEKLPKVAKLKEIRGLKSLLIAVSVPLCAGFVVGSLNAPDGWYSALEKPSWNPPNWVFVLAWSILYPMMGLASWLVWANGELQKNIYPLGLYLTQLVLSLLWPLLFFRFHSPKLALVDVTALAVAQVLCIKTFKPVNHVAAHLMKPCLAWVLLAAALNLSIVMKYQRSPLEKHVGTEF